MCATIGGLCPYPAVPDYSVTFPKPRPANTDPPALSGQVKTLLHLSDIHVDPLYASGVLMFYFCITQPGTDANCNFPICCRDFKNLTKPDRPASKWGDYSCDAPVALLDNLLDSIPKFEPKIDYALITGFPPVSLPLLLSPSDIAPHDVWVATESSVTTVLKTVYASISKHFTAYNITKVFPSVGNHDTAPVNLFPLKSQSRASDWVYHTLADSWKQANWLPDSTILEVADYGTYATRPEPGLKVISLNTNLCYVNDWWIYGKVNELDPNALTPIPSFSHHQASEDAGERVWITARTYNSPPVIFKIMRIFISQTHTLQKKNALSPDVPPGISDCFRNFAHFYYQIIQRYSPHVIVAQFYGHTHRDEFEIFYSDETKRNADTAISVGYVTPSVVPMKNTNSAFR
ncbi:Metallo-dependent phosphatase-like protein [Jimgerdemannia flammicorona]|uniref:Metallo-dependent phosphatase-like protein n=1 Tax=Jimgerdemannia flammicorona TaxID=994334 RepID=A0A433CQ57_9FUNG|nr:Metallo-dependent phosphatase-like protein [Jimgerdemannia flammicorona]